MSAFNEIIEWAKGLPKWQQAIIRDILNGMSFDSARIKGFSDIALDDSRLADDILEGLICSASASRSVRLASVCELNNINNLKDGNCLDFNPSGITVIYGQNGTGKSGYSRIIKKCCRSRDKSAEILGNIHKPDQTESSAKIKYEVDGTPREHIWNKESTTPADLQMAHVFDKTSGEIFLSKEADIQYKPLGMDLLDRLAEILPKIAEELRLRNENLKITDLSSLFQNEYAETEAAKLVGSLGLSDAQTKYERLSKLSESEIMETENLTAGIPLRETSSPAKEREKLIKNNNSLQSVRNYFVALFNLISEDKVDELNKKINTLIVAIKNAEDAKKLSFDSDLFLSGTGNESWKTMWIAAEKFSKEFAYVSQNYPPEVAGVKCVLCQQIIGADHIDFMKQFGAYVNDESQNILSSCMKAIDDARLEIVNTIKRSEDEDTLSKTIEDSFPEIYKSLAISLSSARVLVSAIVNSLEESKNIALDKSELEAHRNNLGAYEKLLQKMDNLLEDNKLILKIPIDDEEYKRQLSTDKNKLNELKARQILKQHETAILNNIRLLPVRKHIESVIKQCGTRGISNKTTDLSNKYIITALSDCFNKELAQIVGNRVKATLIPHGTKAGVPYSKIVLQLRGGQTYGDKIEDVLSEGELRGVSLAGFFAELAMTENTSAIVFDDPVSSLDHINARRIADRIASEIGKRQIIIFSHDILFVSYIMERMERERVDKKIISYVTVESLGQAGLINEGLPFDKLTVKGRIKVLSNLLQSEIRPAYNNAHRAEDYRRLAEKFYKDLRLSWERAVEEILFGDVVKRYSHNVSTQFFKYIRYSVHNAQTVEQNMTLCSSKLLHDPAHIETVDLGTPDDLEKHLKALESFNADNPKKEPPPVQSVCLESHGGTEKRFSFE